MLNNNVPLFKKLRACLYSHFSAWLYSPRTSMMGIVLVCFAYMNAKSYVHMLTQRNYEVYLGETVFYYLNTGFSMVMTSTFLLIMMSEIPKRIAYQNYMLLRIGKAKWLGSQIIFCVIIPCLMLLFLTTICIILSISHITSGCGWSDLVRLAKNPDYAYEAQLVREYIRAIPPWKACAYAGSIILFFWITMLLVVLMFSILGHPNLGILLYMFILQFALTFRFEVIPGMRTPIHYATMAAIANQFKGKEIESVPLVLGIYLLIDIVLVGIMYFHIQHTELFFSEKE